MRTLIILFAAILLSSCSDNIDSITKFDLEGTQWKGVYYELNGNPGSFENVYLNRPRYLSFLEDRTYSFNNHDGFWKFQNEKLFLEDVHNVEILDFDENIMIMEFTLREGDLYEQLSRYIYMVPDQEITYKIYVRRIN